MVKNIEVVAKNANTTSKANYIAGQKIAAEPNTHYQLVVDGKHELPKGTKVARVGKDLMVKFPGGEEFTISDWSDAEGAYLVGDDVPAPAADVTYVAAANDPADAKPVPVEETSSAGAIATGTGTGVSSGAIIGSVLGVLAIGAAAGGGGGGGGGGGNSNNNKPATPSGSLVAGSDSGAQGDNLTNDTTPTISGSGAAAGQTIELRDTRGNVLGSTTVNPDGTWSLTPTNPLSEGTNNLQVVAKDASGNASDPQSFSVNVDSAAPAAVASAPDMTAASDSGTSNTDNLTNDSTPTFSVAAPASGETANLYVDGTLVASSFDAESNTLTPSVGLTQGAHIITTTVSDAAGNESPQSASLAITIDTTGPVAPTALDLAAASDSGTSDSDNRTSNSLPTITGTAEADSSVTLYDSDGTTVLGTGTANGSGEWSIVTSALGEGQHSITAKQSSDAAGNPGTASAPLVVNISDASGTDSTVNVNGDYQLRMSDFGFGDENGGVMSAVRINSGENLFLNGTAVAAGTVVTVTQIIAGQLEWHAPNLNTGTTTEPIGFTVIESTSGGALSAVDNTLTLSRAIASTALLNAVTGTRFDAVQTFSNWQGASDDAIARGGHLASFENGGIAEVNSRWSSFGYGGEVWVGLEQSTNGAEPFGAWHWVTGDTTAPNWGLGEPNNAGPEHVGVLRSDNLLNDATALITIAGYGIEYENAKFIRTGLAGQIDTLNGSARADVIDGKGGADVLSGQGGDDRFIVADSAFASVDGGDGFDVIEYTAAASVDGGALSSKVSNIEAIHLGAGNQSAILSLADVQAMSSATDTLYVTSSGSGDLLTLGELIGSGANQWHNLGTANSLTTYQYFDGENTATSTTLLVDSGINIASLLPPSALDLIDASDTGTSNSDNRTTQINPTIAGTGPANSLITLYDSDGTTVLGSNTSDGAGEWSITTSTLSEGTHNLLARTTDGAGHQSPAAALTINVSLASGTDSTVNVNGDYQLRMSDFGFSDPNGDELAAVRINSAGNLFLNGNPVEAGTVVTVVQIIAGQLEWLAPNLDAGTTTEPISFTVIDSAGSGNLSAFDNTLTLSRTIGENAVLNATTGTRFDAVHNFFDWQGAYEDAIANGGHLATFENGGESDVSARWSSETAGYGGDVWSGLEQSTSGAEPAGGWHWLTGNTSTPNWDAGSGEPNDANFLGEDVGSLRTNNLINDFVATDILEGYGIEYENARFVRTGLSGEIDTMIGSARADVMAGRGGADVLSGLEGDDRFVVEIIFDEGIGQMVADVGSIDGGDGFDTVELIGGSGSVSGADLTSKLQNVEGLVLANNSGVSLNLSKDDVEAMSSSTDALYIATDGNGFYGDVVLAEAIFDSGNAADTGANEWHNLGTAQGLTTFQYYDAGGAATSIKLLIESSINVNNGGGGSF